MSLWKLSVGAVVLFSAFSVYWFWDSPRESNFLRSGLDRWIGLYLGFFTLSLVFSKVPYLSWIELFKLMIVLGAFLVTRYLCRERLQIYRLTEGFVVLGALLSVIGLLQFVGGFPNDWWDRSYFLSSTYVNHNHFAGLLVLIIPITFGLILAERSKAKKTLFIFMSVLMGIAFVFTLSRGGFVALVTAMAWIIWVLKKRRLVSYSILPFTIFLVLVVCAVIIFGTETIERRIEGIRAMDEVEVLSMRFRWMTWNGAISMVRHFFWFGSGPGTFGHVFLQFRPAGGFWMRPVYAHNDLLHLWAECGIFSFLSVTCLAAVFFRQGFSIIRWDDSRFRIGVGSGVMAGMLGLFVHGFFDFNFHIPANWLLSAVAAGLLFSMEEESGYGQKTSAILKKMTYMLVVVLLAVSFYLGFSHYFFWKAKNYLKDGQRESALKLIDRSLSLNPLDAEAYYLRGFTRMAISKASGKEIPPEAISKIVRDFDEAIRINPYEPVYDLAKAKALAEQLAEESPSELTALFEKAILKDPNNRGLAFLVAKEAFGQDRAARYSALRESIGRLLESRQETLAGLVEFLEKNDLWQYHRKYHLKLVGVDPEAAKKNTPADQSNWTPVGVFTLKDFLTTGDEPVTQEELFFRNGELTKRIDILTPEVQLVLSAKGSKSKGKYPVLYVKIDGKVVDEYYVNSTTYQNYSTSLNLGVGSHLLSLEYVNDFRGDGLVSEDRNVWIRRVSLLEV